MRLASPKAILAVLVTARSKRAPEALTGFESKFIDVPSFLLDDSHEGLLDDAEHMRPETRRFVYRSVLAWQARESNTLAGLWRFGRGLDDITWNFPRRDGT